jgi:hypothetical protein
MPLHIIIVSLIATSLLMGVLSLLQDAVGYVRHVQAHRRNSPQAPEYPHPIVLEYPAPGPSLQQRFAPVNRSPAAVWHGLPSRRRA